MSKNSKFCSKIEILSKIFLHLKFSELSGFLRHSNTELKSFRIWGSTTSCIVNLGGTILSIGGSKEQAQITQVYTGGMRRTVLKKELFKVLIFTIFSKF